MAADGMKRITMELGGHAPVLIFDDCDLEKTLDMVVPAEIPQRRPGLRLADPLLRPGAASTRPSSRASPSAPPR